MKPPIGNRDTLVSILGFTETTDPDFGTTSKVWAVVAQEWCEVRDFLPSRSEEQIAAAINVARRPTRVRMLYRPDITADMRLRIDGVDYEIIAGPAVLGRKDGLEFVCELFSVQGERP